MTGGIESESTDPTWKPMTKYSQASFSSPEQMRALADEVAEEPLETWVSKALPALRAAADEVARLRVENATWQKQWADTLVAATDWYTETQQLRAVIEKAPHENECMQRLGGIMCDCWKADAL